MTFDANAAGQPIFVDANSFLYYFTAHPRYGPACDKLLERIENKDLTGFTSSSVLTEIVHRLMTIEACQRLAGRPRASPVGCGGTLQKCNN
jgi:predicted nucleic acid-binding protein